MSHGPLDEESPELAELLRDSESFGLRCVALEVSLLAAREASVAGFEPVGAALDRLRSAPVLEQNGLDALAAVRARVGAFAEERQQAAVDRGASRSDDVFRSARAVAVVYWALHPDPARAAAQATYEALFAGCDRREIEEVVRRSALERAPS